MLAPPRKTAPGGDRGGAEVVKNCEDWQSRNSSAPSPRQPHHFLKAKLLTAEEERGLDLRALAGDRDAKAELAKAFEPLVRAEASRYWSALNPEDREQDARIGLLKAIDKLDPNKGRLGAYARHWIWNELNRSAEKTPEFTEMPPPWDPALIDEHELNGAFTDVAPDGIRLDRVEAAAEEVLDRREWRIYSARRLSRERPNLRELGDELGLSGERVRKIETRAVEKVEARLNGTKPLTQSRQQLRLKMARLYAEVPVGRSPEAMDAVIDMARKRFPEATAEDRRLAHRAADRIRARFGTRRRRGYFENGVWHALLTPRGEVARAEGEDIIDD
jgi:RNA polymerase sigma factor (sigma-70 family)